jgi:hypothetical protein
MLHQARIEVDDSRISGIRVSDVGSRPTLRDPKLRHTEKVETDLCNKTLHLE